MSHSPTYAELEIRIYGREAAGYPVEMTLNGNRHFPRTFCQPEDLTGLQQNGDGLWRWQKVAVADAEDTDGEAIFNWLFGHPDLKPAWTAALESASSLNGVSACRVRLRIEDSAPELHAVPWEMLRGKLGDAVEHVAASARMPISRYLALAGPAGGPILQRPIKVLAAIAAPSDLKQIFNLDVHVDQEEAILQQIAAHPDIDLTILNKPCSLTNLSRELAKGYHVLHFVGHGLFEPVTQETTLLMAGRDGPDDTQTDRVTGTAFCEQIGQALNNAEILRDEKLRLIFLCSCDTAVQTQEDAARDLAVKLVHAGAPAVLAMQGKIPVTTAHAFMPSFYTELLSHGQADLACNLARSAVLSDDNLSGAWIPVLYSRLPKNELLTRPGRLASADHDQDFWPSLLNAIWFGECIPFLGPGVHESLLPSHADIARELAEEWEYPFLLSGSRADLMRVSQFVDVNKMTGNALRRSYLRSVKRGIYRYLNQTLTDAELDQAPQLSQIIANNGAWVKKVATSSEGEIHHLLAEIGLPLYVTTNADNFMFEALNQQKNVTPSRVGLRWRSSDDQVLASEPSRDHPVVYHLNGYDGDPSQERHLVLTEDDFLRHFTALARDQDKLVHSDLLEFLANGTFLFLGYNIDDWEFRVLLQGLLDQIGPATWAERRHLGVQLDPTQNENPERVGQYWQKYLGRYHIDVYWGTPQQFVLDLHARWQAYKRQHIQGN